MPFFELDAIESTELIPGLHVRFVHSEFMTFAYWTIEAGAELPAHNHKHEQVAHVIDGEFELTINGETKRLSGGQVAVIPPDAQHSGRAVTNCHIIDAFYPVREDYLGQASSQAFSKDQ